ncbi:macro domain-containing protein [Paracidovorax oryzae]|uniref:macro domain-containing protein n=1 Tax=Paracidovorax oryzae TaxID=862720 RepID=UPI0004797599|nr:macro domain-containing protein [Paracidovorax oryzae]
MKFFIRSLATASFWKYALFSRDALIAIFATVGSLYFLMEFMDFLGIYTKDKYSKFAIFPILAAAILWVITTRRPVSRVGYKVPKRDVMFEVKIGDIFAEGGDTVISTNTTFDTDMASGLISPDSLQGQLALKFFQGNTAEIDRQLAVGLSGVNSSINPNALGKKHEYPIGTVAKVNAGNKTFYFLAMSRLNSHGTAYSTLRDVEDALECLWQFIADQGHLHDLAVPLVGTGRGRIDTSRKKMTEKIAQSFADAAIGKVFSNKLTIMIRPEDAERFQVNLFEIKDYLSRSLHI